MDKQKRLLDPLTEHILPATECNMTWSDSKIHVADERMARLLLMLHEIDQAVAGLEELPQAELIELVSSAILACGFAEGVEARCAISEVLELIESRGPIAESS
jgi:hypothetical protein